MFNIFWYRKHVQQMMEHVYEVLPWMAGNEEDEWPDCIGFEALDVDQLNPSLTLNMSHEAGWTSVYHDWIPSNINHSTPIKEESDTSGSTTILYSDSELSLYDVTPEPQAQPDLLDV